jgi:outer membrane protein
MKVLKVRLLTLTAAFSVWVSLAYAQAPETGGGTTDASVPAATQVPHAPHVLPEEKSWRFGVGLGYGARSNPLIQSESIPVVVDLDIAWFGERWFFDNFDLGFSLVDHARFTVNAVARVNSDRAFFGKTNTRYVNFALTQGGAAVPIASAPGAGSEDSPSLELKVPKRDYAVEAGLEMLLDGEWGQSTLRAFHDVSGTHRGYEVSADYSYRFTRGRFSLAPSVGVAYKSARLSDYYWGVHADEVRRTLLGYEADAGIGWEAGLRASYYLTKRLRLAVSANYERLHHSVADSPIVERPYVFGYFGGLAWQF